MHFKVKFIKVHEKGGNLQSFQFAKKIGIFDFGEFGWREHKKNRRYRPNAIVVVLFQNLWRRLKRRESVAEEVMDKIQMLSKKIKDAHFETTS